MSEDRFECPFCKKEYFSKNAWASHKGKCKLNPDHIVKPKSELWLAVMKQPKTEEHKAKISKGVQKAYAEGKGYKGEYWRGRKHTEETKKKISEGVKKWCDSHPEELPYVKYHSSKESYPEKYFREVLENNSIKFEQEFVVSRYSLDFAFPDTKKYFEVDGKQHEYMAEHDKIREEFLKEKGWKLICRIQWWKFKEKSPEDQKQYCEDLIKNIMGC